MNQPLSEICSSRSESQPFGCDLLSSHLTIQTKTWVNANGSDPVRGIRYNQGRINHLQGPIPG